MALPATFCTQKPSLCAEIHDLAMTSQAQGLLSSAGSAVREGSLAGVSLDPAVSANS